jgi:prepilin-type N-terminal cleavage/methylation domain-containing protein
MHDNKELIFLPTGISGKKADILLKVVGSSHKANQSWFQALYIAVVSRGIVNMIKITLLRNKPGFSLLEVMIAIAIIGIVVAGFLGGMSNAIKGALKNDQMETARTLAVGQMEYVKKLPFAASYTPGDSTVYDSVQNKFINYNGYSASITSVIAAERNINIQKLTVTILFNGEAVATLDDCKVK